MEREAEEARIEAVAAEQAAEAARKAKKKQEKEAEWHREMMKVRKTNFEESRSPQSSPSPIRSPKKVADNKPSRPEPIDPVVAAQQGLRLTRDELGGLKLKAMQEYCLGLGMLKRDVMLCVGKRELIDMVSGFLETTSSAEPDQARSASMLVEKLEADLVRMEFDNRSRNNSVAVSLEEEEEEGLGGGGRDWKGEMTELYIEKGMGALVMDIDRLLVKYRGREQDLIDKIEAKYGPRERI